MAGRLRSTFGRGLVVAVLVLTGMTTACLSSSDEAAPTELASVSADYITYGVTKNISREGIREAVLRADSMFMWNDSSHVLIQGLSLRVYDERGGLRATITSTLGRLIEATDELTATGNALLRIPVEDREIRSSELHFSPGNNRVWSDSSVVMRQGNCELKGDGLEARLTFDEVRILGTREQECVSR